MRPHYGIDGLFGYLFEAYSYLEYCQTYCYFFALSIKMALTCLRASLDTDS